MRARSLALAAAALPLALALASCSGGAAAPEAPSPLAPTAVATPEATSTSAPTAIATPEAPTTPEQACANGVAVADPEAHPGLVADCEALLRARDALRGDASLDWGGGLAVADWEGVAVSGEPSRVTSLDLRNKSLTGSIPRELRRLRLGEVRLGGNALTGCVPSAFEDASGDAARLGLPWCLRYDRLDAAGEAASAGEWAILGGNGEALTTWERLRSEAATLRVHQTDGGGNSWASEFGAVAVNDLFEWRLADDCWVRYRVAGAPVAPSGASVRWEFPVKRVSYAPTGCAGAIPAAATLRADEDPRDLYWTDVASPFWHGPYIVYPGEWSGAWPDLPSPPPGPAIAASAPEGQWPTYDHAEVRRHPYWRDPAIPSGWTLFSAGADADGVAAMYENGGGLALGIRITRWDRWTPIYAKASRGDAFVMIHGYPAMVYAHGSYISIFDDSTGLKYDVAGYDSSIRENAEAVTAIAVSLLPPAGAQ